MSESRFQEENLDVECIALAITTHIRNHWFSYEIIICEFSLTLHLHHWGIGVINAYHFSNNIQAVVAMYPQGVTNADHIIDAMQCPTHLVGQCYVIIVAAQTQENSGRALLGRDNSGKVHIKC